MYEEDGNTEHVVVIGTGFGRDNGEIERIGQELAPVSEAETGIEMVIQRLPSVPVIGGLAVWALEGWRSDFKPRYYRPNPSNLRGG
jgi:hypothetical protein